jgi:CheY-like chemotaxis protein
VETILVVEDDKALQGALSEALEEEGYGVRKACNGREALQDLKAERPSPQLILLDLVMPQMNGWQFLDERKRNPILSRIPVLVMTSLWGDARLPGKTPVLHKPFQPLDLFRSVRQALAAAAPS